MASPRIRKVVGAAMTGATYGAAALAILPLAAILVMLVTKGAGSWARAGKIGATAHTQVRAAMPICTRRLDRACRVIAGSFGLPVPRGVRRPAAPFDKSYSSGSANTHRVEPAVGSTMSGVSDPTERAWLEPLPTATATYCLPSTS